MMSLVRQHVLIYSVPNSYVTSCWHTSPETRAVSTGITRYEVHHRPSYGHRWGRVSARGVVQLSSTHGLSINHGRSIKNRAIANRVLFEPQPYLPERVYDMVSVVNRVPSVRIDSSSRFCLCCGLGRIPQLIFTPLWKNVAYSCLMYI